MGDQRKVDVSVSSDYAVLKVTLPCFAGRDCDGDVVFEVTTDGVWPVAVPCGCDQGSPEEVERRFVEAMEDDADGWRDAADEARVDDRMGR